MELGYRRLQSNCWRHSRDEPWQRSASRRAMVETIPPAILLTHCHVPTSVSIGCSYIKAAYTRCSRLHNKCIAVRKVATPLRELTCHMGSHSVTCHPAEVAFQPLPQPKLVLDSATPEGCKAELTYNRLYQLSTSCTHRVNAA